MTTSSTTLEQYWRELVSSALLGTDRRDPPSAPPGLLADVVADALLPDPGTRMLATVAVVAATRRAAFVPLPPADLLQPPEPDPRPYCSTSASATWREVVSSWPVLEDEWMLVLLDNGLRLPPDVLVEALRRHRTDPVRRSRTMIAGGSLASWIVEQIPELEAASTRTISAGAGEQLPELPIPPDLAELLEVDAHTFVQRLLPGFQSHEYGPAHRAVLINLLARCRPAVLPDAANALTHVGSGLAIALADLSKLRHRMLTELSGTAMRSTL